MRPERFSTHDLANPTQLDAWREWYASSYEVFHLEDGADSFAASSELWTLNGLGIARVSAPPLRASRTKVLTRRDPVDHICLTIGLRAETRFAFDSDMIRAPAGAPFLFGLDEPHVSQRHSDERWQFYIARDQFRQAMPALDAARGKIVNSHLGDLLTGYLQLVVRSLPTLTEEEAARLPQAVVAMIVACMAPSADEAATARSSSRAARLQKVRRAVLQGLSSPHLDADALCREVGISRSNLYRLLEPEGGVANYIKNLRLLECFEQLSDPLNEQPIGEIAQNLNMLDRSSFGRAFRKKFGVTPGEVREAARAGAAAVGGAAPACRDPSAAKSFRNFLQEF